jgi:hypothetical protein
LEASGLLWRVARNATALSIRAPWVPNLTKS